MTRRFRSSASPRSARKSRRRSIPLTQLHSRRYFLQRGIQDLSYARRHGAPLSLIRVDLDNFRTVYRAHGDHACDEILVWLAKFITATTRAEDTAARISGGEFAMLVPATDRAEAAALCERLRAAVTREPFRHNDQAIPLTVSLGLASFGAGRPGHRRGPARPRQPAPDAGQGQRR